MDKLIIKTQGNSIDVGGTLYQKGRLFFTKTENGIIYSGRSFLFGDVECDGVVLGDADELHNWIADNVFSDGGGDGSGVTEQWVNDGFVKKVTTSGTELQFYGKNATGAQVMVDLSYIQSQSGVVIQTHSDNTNVTVNANTTHLVLPKRTGSTIIYINLNNLPKTAGRKLVIINYNNAESYSYFATNAVLTPSGAEVKRLAFETTTEITCIANKWTLTNISLRNGVYELNSYTNMIYLSGTYIISDTANINDPIAYLVSDNSDNLDIQITIKNVTSRPMIIQSFPSITNIVDSNKELVSSVVLPVGKTVSFVGIGSYWQLITNTYDSATFTFSEKEKLLKYPVSLDNGKFITGDDLNVPTVRSLLPIDIGIHQNNHISSSDTNGEFKSFLVTTEVVADSVPRRLPGGEIAIGSATAGNHATTLNQVTEMISDSVPESSTIASVFTSDGNGNNKWDSDTKYSSKFGATKRPRAVHYDNLLIANAMTSSSSRFLVSYDMSDIGNNIDDIYVSYNIVKAGADTQTILHPVLRQVNTVGRNLIFDLYKFTSTGQLTVGTMYEADGARLFIEIVDRGVSAV